ncbi:ATP-binding protein [Oscillospiraceae bacterium MB08-C2-2]|nr:ATP-binding protein [Oscillospiraceae bacterium MB08-C2-2]
MQQSENSRQKLASLVIFRGLLKDPAVSAFRELLAGENLPMLERTEKAAELSHLLLEAGQSWSGYLLQRALWDENPYVTGKAAGKEFSASLETALGAELVILEELGSITPEMLGVSLPLGWQTEALDFAAAYSRQLARIGEAGYGIFARHHMFLLGEEALIPVVHPDSVTLEGLTGYTEERQAVIDNTVALLEGRPAANVLLYGDSGTGKSTCVKAVANSLREKGLRLIELRKDQLGQIPLLIDRLSGNPLKFILFIDDLSFTGESDHFSSLKAILEGSVSARTANMVIYATSNRRHLVRETFSQRDGDDVHIRDTLEELGSLSERFGLTITFLRPDRKLYLEIVERYCIRHNLVFDEAMAQRAEAYALSRGGRSARTARQFIENAASRLSANEEEPV